jgi:hypothetical protein
MQRQGLQEKGTNYTSSYQQQKQVRTQLDDILVKSNRNFLYK